MAVRWGKSAGLNAVFIIVYLGIALWVTTSWFYQPDYVPDPYAITTQVAQDCFSYLNCTHIYCYDVDNCIGGPQNVGFIENITLNHTFIKDVRFITADFFICC